MSTNTQAILKLILYLSFILVQPSLAFDEEDYHDQQQQQTTTHHGPIPKDKILLTSLESLTFQRNKRTTSRRTHSIPQLSCVGGTAGCKLFTPNLVECHLVDHDVKTNKYNWNCEADFKGRVKFNHIDIICEGYDYPEDDYKLLGSCGLEFTLDYVNAHDYHHQSYHEHLDEHEKDLYIKKKAPPGVRVNSFYSQIEQLIFNLTDHMLFIMVIFVLLLLFAYIFSNRAPSSQKSSRPLASPILTTKKTC